MSSVREVAHGRVDLDQIAARVPQVELHRSVHQPHAHQSVKGGVDHAELARSAIERQEVVDRETQVVARRRLVVGREEDVELHIPDAIPVDAEAEVGRRNALGGERAPV